MSKILIYTDKVGLAAREYLNEFPSKYEIWLPENFSWEELFNRMIAAAVKDISIDD